jgi:hypothetical protein
MGMFLALSGIIGKSHAEVTKGLLNYTFKAEGGLVEEKLNYNDNNCCIIGEANANTTIIYPNDFLEWDDASEFLSKELNVPVFSFHIHDGDLWMYLLYVNGVVVDQFNPIPDYWDENMDEEEINSWKGNATVLTAYIAGLRKADIEKYLVRWDLEADPIKAYPTDEYTNEDWQLLDFMRAIKLPYPLDDNDNVTGETYKMWTKQLKINPITPARIIPPQKQKPWWQFW